METTEISLIHYLVNSAGMLLLIFFFMGINIKLSQILFAVLAYPVYLALFAFESRFKSSEKRQFLMLNIPEKNPKRFWMNFSASLVTLFLMPNVFQFYYALSLPEAEQANSIINLIFGTSSLQFWCNLLAVFFVFIVYLISYTTDVDKRDSWEKIENLSVPSLWKNVIKKV